MFACPYLNALERDSWEGIYFARKKKEEKKQSRYNKRKEHYPKKFLSQYTMSEACNIFY